MKNTDTHKVVLPTGDTSGKAATPAFAQVMNLLIGILTKLGLLKEDLDYHVVRASMVIIYFFFGYQKWFAYEAQGLIPFISNGPLISWMYPVFGIQGASWFLGVSEWLFGLGCVGRRLSSNGWQCCFPYEGRGSFCRVILFAEAGCRESVTFGGFGKGILRPF